ncbi:MAG TPA: hypothetical protein VGF67_23460 [Ktedonobacteraceae bacterium]
MTTCRTDGKNSRGYRVEEGPRIAFLSRIKCKEARCGPTLAPG